MADNFIQLYEEIADKHNAAYDNFRRTYEKENPMPLRSRVDSDGLLVFFSLLFLVVASVIVSGSRTIEEFGGGLVGGSAFMMLEIGIVIYAFFRTKTDMDKQRIVEVRLKAKRGLALAFVVAVAANVHNVLKTRGIIISADINTIINILVAISAPTLAFVSGDIMALEWLKNKQKLREAEEKHELSITVWKQGLDDTWQRQRGNWGVKVRVESATLELPSPSNGNSIGNQERKTIPTVSTLGHKKEPDATEKATSHLEQNAEVFLSWKKSDLVNELKSIGVGKSTAYKVIDAFFNARQQTDGGDTESEAG